MAFNSESFPTSETAVRMLERVSPIYARSYVAKWLYQVMGLELDEVRQLFEELPLQAMPDTATWGLRYWEDLYAIQTDKALDLDTRREAVLCRRALCGSFNPARLETMIRTTFGCAAVVTENVAPYTFQVTLTDSSQWLEITQWLKQIKPSHLTVQFVQAAESLSVQCGAGVCLIK